MKTNRVSMGASVRLGIGLAALLLAVGPWLSIRAGEVTKPASGETAADNGLCYVCHLSLQNEEITSVHLKEKIGCANCHGTSAEHMHDEMLMSKPDHLFGRREVDGMCGKCHEQPHQDKSKEVQAFLRQWQGRDRPNGRVITEKSICTDCHGTHNIAKESAAKKEQEDKAVEWTPLFNGTDLTGWKCAGSGVWSVKSGRIVAMPGAGDQGSDLWSEAELADCLLTVTFRAAWPVHAGLWLRSGEAGKGARVEVFENALPQAYSGSVRDGKGALALLNLRKDLLDPGGWNTISVELRGDRAQVWLNGEEIGAVRAPMAAKGRIGLHLESGREYQNGEFAVREILVQKLPEQPSK